MTNAMEVHRQATLGYFVCDFHCVHIFILLIGPCVLACNYLTCFVMRGIENFSLTYHCSFEYFYNYFLYLSEDFSFSRSLQKDCRLIYDSPFSLDFHYLNGCSCVYGFIITNFEIYNRTFFLFMSLFYFLLTT